MQVNTVDELISDIRQGRMVVLLDDDGTDLVTMGAGKWSSLWWYMEFDDELHMVYDTAQYNNSGQAEAAGPPASLPELTPRKRKRNTELLLGQRTERASFSLRMRGASFCV